MTIHANPFRGVWEDGMWMLGNGLSRVAVPAFFVVAGYTFRPELPGRSRRIALRYLWLHALWLMLYAPFWWPAVAAGGPLIYAEFWIFGYWHLWFLVALAIAVALAQGLWRLRAGAILAVALGLLFAGFALQWAIGFDLLPRGFWPDARNGVLMGLPFFLLGYLTRIGGWEGRISPSVARWSAGLGLLAVVAESALMRGLSGPHPLAPETLLSAAFAGPALVIAAVQLRNLPDWLARLPLGLLSAGIYFIHVGIVISLNPLGLPRVIVYLLAVSGAGLMTWGLIRTRLVRFLF